MRAQLADSAAEKQELQQELDACKQRLLQRKNAVQRSDDASLQLRRQVESMAKDSQALQQEMQAER